ncbi:MAG: type II toxin-antitoxin system RelE/ParE family toxin [Myxococcales bacterium]|nr:type II toxin-antitoxin system RelE/ParE family toxin [Myxococcales bacterium]
MKILFYYTGRGDSPVEDYVAGLPEHEQKQIDAALKNLAALGTRGSSVPLRQIRGKLWEIKVQPHRIFYALRTRSALVLLHAYRKQGQKAPRVEIETALMRLRKIEEQEAFDDSHDD